MIINLRHVLSNNWLGWSRIISIIPCVWASAFNVAAQEVSVHENFSAMGSRFGVTVVLTPTQLDSSQYIINAAKAEINRIENLISSWHPDSETSRINLHAGEKPAPVSNELFDLIKRGQFLSELTSGAFDITFAGLDKLWRFDGTMTELPDSMQVAKSKQLIDYKEIILDSIGKTVLLGRKGMRIGFGGMGKGYAADKVKTLLRSKGVKSGVVDAGGDLTTWGSNENNLPWKIGIRKPGKDEKPIGFIDVTDLAVVTSGNYERFAEIEGQRYAHIIDPRTGWPSKGIKSVTVVGPSAELCDALATAVYVMGTEAGLDLVAQLSGVECVIIDDEDHIFTTKGIALLPKESN